MKLARDRSTNLPAWWVEAAVLLPVYYLYTATRGVADASAADAVAVGWDLQRFSEAVYIDIELGLNHWLQSLPVLAVISCYYYATLHFLVTPAVLFWMHRRHPGSYIQARWTIAFTTLICLVGFFVVPTAPPRLLPGSGYVDTMSYFAEWGWWSESSSAAPDGLASLANQYAALPSLHCAWSLWCGFLLVRYARTRVVRVLGVLYPAATLFVTMATANHYLVDGLAGYAVLGVAALLALAVARRRARAALDVAPPDRASARPAPAQAELAESGPAESGRAEPAPRSLAPSHVAPTRRGATVPASAADEAPSAPSGARPATETTSATT